MKYLLPLLLLLGGCTEKHAYHEAQACTKNDCWTMKSFLYNEECEEYVRGMHNLSVKLDGETSFNGFAICVTVYR